jgi:hypothetical protein
MEIPSAASCAGAGEILAACRDEIVILPLPARS